MLIPGRAQRSPFRCVRLKVIDIRGSVGRLLVANHGDNVVRRRRLSIINFHFSLQLSCVAMEKNIQSPCYMLQRHRTWRHHVGNTFLPRPDGQIPTMRRPFGVESASSSFFLPHLDLIRLSFVLFSGRIRANHKLA